jgi:hypothetical protein
MKYRARIKQILPNTKIETIVENTGGLSNTVFIVNRKFVFRFSKTSTESFEVEARLLNLIRPRMIRYGFWPILRALETSRRRGVSTL